uniref:Uncharacterized protein LOC114324734 n=1 Tax=Diabrotica virgifera virgifera TaxID=50390 RepID=A0A6P7F3C9_DIAVI
MYYRIISVCVLLPVLLLQCTEGMYQIAGPRYWSEIAKRDPLYAVNPLYGVQVEKECVCMNWRYCEGTINSDKICPGSYTKVCCNKPEIVTLVPPPVKICDPDENKLEIEGMEDITPCV